MLEFLKNMLRKRYLKKHASHIPTRITPLERIHSAVAFIDVEDTSFDQCKEDILSFYRENGIKGDIFFFDFRKIGSEERLITSIKTTVLRRDLNWCGKPSQEKIDLMLGSDPDLFISLIDGTDFPIAFMAACSQARFKIGRRQLPGGTFDLVIQDPADKRFSEAEVFANIRKFLLKIDG